MEIKQIINQLIKSFKKWPPGIKRNQNSSSLQTVHLSLLSQSSVKSTNLQKEASTALKTLFNKRQNLQSTITSPKTDIFRNKYQAKNIQHDIKKSFFSLSTINTTSTHLNTVLVLARNNNFGYHNGNRSYQADLSGKKVLTTANEFNLPYHDLIAKGLFEKAVIEYTTYIKQQPDLNKPIKVFISHTWGSKFDDWLDNVVNYLSRAGIEVSYDKNNINRANTSANYTNINQFVATMLNHDRIILIGNMLYCEKAMSTNTDINQREPGLVSEVKYIQDHLSTFNDMRRRKLLPLLLDGNIESSFPPMLVTDKDLVIYFYKNNHFLKFFEMMDAIFNIVPASLHYKSLIAIRERLIQDLQKIDNSITSKDQEAFLAAKKVREEKENADSDARIEAIKKEQINKIKNTPDVPKAKPLSEFAKEYTEQDNGNNNNKSSDSQSNSWCAADLILNFFGDNTRKFLERIPRNQRKLFLVILFLALLLILLMQTEEKRKRRTNLPQSALPVDKNVPLEKLNEVTNKFNQSNVQTVAMLAITGIPGSGKTELAKLYADKFFERHGIFSERLQQTAIEWIPFLTKSHTIFGEIGIASKIPIVWFLNGITLEKDYIALADKLHIPSNQNIEDIIRAVNIELSLTDNWLLIFDDIQKIDDIENYLKFNQGTHGKVLITTRNINFFADPAKHINLSKGMEINEAKELLIRISGLKPNSEVEVEDLARELDRLPLALATAALTIKNENHDRLIPILTYCGYKEKLNTKRNEIKVREVEIRGADEDYKKTQSAVIQLLLETLQKDNKGQAAIKLLHLCSLINNNSIPQWLLSAYWEQLKLDNKLEFNQVLNEAKASSLLNIEKHSKSGNVKDDLYFIHHVTQYELQQTMNKTEINLAIDLLEKQWSTSNVKKEEFEKHNLLLGHTKSLLEKIKVKKDILGLNETFKLNHIENCMASLYTQINKANEAKALLVEVKSELDEHLKANNININDPAAICNYLSRKNKAWPTRYASTLYFLFRTYFYAQSEGLPIELERALDMAIAMREIIDNDKKLGGKKYDDSANKYKVDTGVFKRQGKALLLIIKGEKSDDKSQALNYLNQAEKLLNNLVEVSTSNPDYKDDILFKPFCLELLAKVYLKKALLEENSVMRRQMLEEACAYLIGETNDKEGALVYVKNKSENLTKVSKFHNTLGDIYAAYNDTEHQSLAIASYENTLKTTSSEHKEILIEAHTNLAHQYSKQYNSPNGRIAYLLISEYHANRSLTLQDEVNRSRSSSAYQTILDLLKDIEREISELNNKVTHTYNLIM